MLVKTLNLLHVLEFDDYNNSFKQPVDPLYVITATNFMNVLIFSLQY